jgi:hypothetical protein
MGSVLGGGGGDFGDFNVFDPGSKLLHDVGVSDEDLTGLSSITDPMDLFGYRARDTREQMRSTQLGAAQRAMAEQQRQFGAAQEMYAPYRELGEGALPQLQYLATGQGDPYQFQLSDAFQQRRELGETTLSRAQAATGARGYGEGSSAAQDQFAGFYADLIGEEMQQQTSGLYDLVRMGQGAAGAVGQAGASAAQGVGSIYGNLGTQTMAAAQNYGAQRQASMQGGANALSGLASYFG